MNFWYCNLWEINEQACEPIGTLVGDNTVFRREETVPSDAGGDNVEHVCDNAAMNTLIFANLLQLLLTTTYYH
ncbi:unnamed protein product [Gongylonema pulchrum]|uniref:Uncharacterized protein n=1 Tax=Gongylonema pulchrum TaxID=637853 RepID=A0A183EZZ1_9BILA|nr:unnamed protein product [Gongylonema pulchrum]